jgi:hypothetical protein
LTTFVPVWLRRIVGQSLVKSGGFLKTRNEGCRGFLEGRSMDTTKTMSIQRIATDFDDFSLYLRVRRLDRIADLLDEARIALSAIHVQRGVQSAF